MNSLCWGYDGSARCHCNCRKYSEDKPFEHKTKTEVKPIPKEDTKADRGMSDKEIYMVVYHNYRREVGFHEPMLSVR